MADNTRQRTPTTEEQIEKLMERFEDVNNDFIAKIAEQILIIGEMNRTSIDRLTIMADMNENMAIITGKLAQALRLGVMDVYKIYQRALNDVYTDPRFKRALTNEPLSDAAKARLNQLARSVSIQTAGTMRNMSNTTIFSEQYRSAIDKAVLAVASGIGDYKTATRDAIRDIGSAGMQVKYPSGYRRRMDTAVRQNIIDGVKQITQHGSDIMGEELGYDAYELSAHAMSAPDHEPVQGRVFLISEFEKMQNDEPFEDIDGNHYEGFPRNIGEWNCMHFAMSFSTKYSVRKYTDEQLKALYPV